MLPVVPPVEHPLVAVQLVRHGLTIDLHTGSENDQLKPLGHLKISILDHRSAYPSIPP